MKKIILLTVLILIAITAGFFISSKLNQKDLAKSIDTSGANEAIFAGGCFWCVESDFEKLSGVIDVVSGYSGGEGENPSYENYINKGHIEVVKVIYDEQEISYEQLLEYFWKHIDPLDSGGQFCDRGHAYISSIFHQSFEEEKLAMDSKKKVEEVLNEKVATEILKFEKFWIAEDYHQDYYKKHPLKYPTYRKLCGRDNRVKEIWGDKILNLMRNSSYYAYVIDN